MLEQIAQIRILLANINNNYHLILQENEQLRKENAILKSELENVNRTTEQSNSESETSN